MDKALNLISQQKDFLFFSKPAGIHSTQGNGESGISSLEKAITQSFPEQLGLPEAGLMQRLDFYTSGVITAARSAGAREKFKDHQSRGLILKHYLALVEGAPLRTGNITAYFYSRYRSSKKVSVELNLSKSPRRAVQRETKLQVLHQWEDKSLLHCCMPQGARHQIRALCAALGSPLLGDSVYNQEKPKVGEGFYLHSLLIESLSALFEATQAAMPEPMKLALGPFSDFDEQNFAHEISANRPLSRS